MKPFTRFGKWNSVVAATLLLCLVLSACGPEPTASPLPPTEVAIVPTDTPLPPTDTPIPPTDTPIPPTDTPVPTDTPIPPTDTPMPTDTPIPPTDTPVPPTNTPEPTDTPTQEASPTAKPTVVATAQPELTFEAFMSLLMLADSLYRAGDYEGAAVVYSEMLHHEMEPVQKARTYVLRAGAYERLGTFEAAIADYILAVDLGREDADTLNNLCWDYGITGQAELALPYCEQAVAGDPSAAHRDSRGVAYAQLGQLDAALDDFQAVVDDLQGTTDPALVAIRARRQEWVTALQAGQNPCTPEVLEELQAETRATSVSPSFEPDPEMSTTRSFLQESAEQAGFQFGEVTESAGQESVTGESIEGDCKSILSLIGPETGITRATLQLTGCDDETQSGQAFWFMSQFLQSNAQFAKALTWLVTDIYYVIETIATEPVTKEIGNTTFSARFTSDPQPTFEIAAEIHR